jgi:hypothetical protein
MMPYRPPVGTQTCRCCSSVSDENEAVLTHHGVNAIVFSVIPGFAIAASAAPTPSARIQRINTPAPQEKGDLTCVV